MRAIIQVLWIKARYLQNIVKRKVKNKKKVFRHQVKKKVVFHQPQTSLKKKIVQTKLLKIFLMKEKQKKVILNLLSKHHCLLLKFQSLLRMRKQLKHPKHFSKLLIGEQESQNTITQIQLIMYLKRLHQINFLSLIQLTIGMNRILTVVWLVGCLLTAKSNVCLIFFHVVIMHVCIVLSKQQISIELSLIVLLITVL